MFHYVVDCNHWIIMIKICISCFRRNPICKALAQLHQSTTIDKTLTFKHPKIKAKFKIMVNIIYSCTIPI